MNVTTAPPPTSVNAASHRGEPDTAGNIAVLRSAIRSGALDDTGRLPYHRMTVVLLRLLAARGAQAARLERDLAEALRARDLCAADALVQRNWLADSQAGLARERRRAEVCRRYADEIAAQARDLNAENRVMRANRETDLALIADLRARLALEPQPGSRRAHGRGRRSR